ncbi:MAG: hypothetical protein ACE368_11670 [Paracoccaceae bacterium]
MQDTRKSIEATLLYREQPEIGFVALLERLNAALARLDLRFTSGPLIGEDFVVFNHPDMHVVVTVNRAPMQADRLWRALAAPITRMKRHDYAAAVNAHTRHVQIKVADGAHYGSTDTSVGQVPAATKMRVLHRAVLAALELERADAVFMTQSDMIFMPEEVEATAGMDFPAPLTIHPVPFEARDKSGTGLRIEGSELFCTRPLVIAPGPLPLPVAISVAEHLVARCAAQPGFLCDRSMIPFSETLNLTTAHHAARMDDPLGRVEIAFTPVFTPEFVTDEETCRDWSKRRTPCASITAASAGQVHLSPRPVSPGTARALFCLEPVAGPEPRGDGGSVCAGAGLPDGQRGPGDRPRDRGGRA